MTIPHPNTRQHICPECLGRDREDCTTCAPHSPAPLTRVEVAALIFALLMFVIVPMTRLMINAADASEQTMASDALANPKSAG